MIIIYIVFFLKKRKIRSIVRGQPTHSLETQTAQVLSEDLVLVKGQQDRMKQGADVWANPVMYDKLGVRYRRWRNEVENGKATLSADYML